MNKLIRVAVCGHSVAWAAVEVLLEQLGDVTLCSYSAAELWAILPSLPADVLLVDSAAVCVSSDVLRRKLPPSVTLIALDISSGDLVAYLSRTSILTSLADLDRVIHNAEH